MFITISVQFEYQSFIMISMVKKHDTIDFNIIKNMFNNIIYIFTP